MKSKHSPLHSLLHLSAVALAVVVMITSGSLKGYAGGQDPAVKSGPGESDTGVVAQTTSQEKDPAQNPITHPLALSPDVGPERIGVDLNQKRLMSLQDAVRLALQRNLDIEASRQGVQIAQSNLFSTRGAFDVTSSLNFNYRSQTFPQTNTFQVASSGATISQNIYTYNFSTNQLLEKTGGIWQIDFDNSRATSSSSSALFTSQYNPALTFSISQPIMRNLSIDPQRQRLALAKRSLNLSDSAFRQMVIEIISSVQRAYWDLVFAIRNEKIARDSVELARVQLENNRKMVAAGTLAPIDLRSTEAALELRKGDVIVALQGITTAENALKALLINEDSDALWSSVIEPVDEPQHGQTVLSLAEATQLALKNRPELEQSKLQIEQNDVDIKFFKSQTKPQADLIAFYSTSGLAGTPSTVVRDGFVIGDAVATRFRGGYRRALRNLFTLDFPTYQAGIQLSFPWRNRTAEGNLGRALATSRQLDARHRQLVQSIQFEVRNALQAVEAARLRHEAARANTIAAEAQWRGEVERFRAGLQTNFFVLQRQTELSQARGAELRALTDYNKALADLQRVTGLTLVSNNVEVPSTDTGAKN